jgi:hypothetical protein
MTMTVLGASVAAITLKRLSDAAAGRPSRGPRSNLTHPILDGSMVDFYLE